uniref:Laminin G domain-containing protein n=1 Tax=Ditylenchus dipsaci TaxID=166011 RepID=A0A915EQH0_9BILA
MISTKTDTRRRMRRDLEKGKFNQKVRELEEEAYRIQGIYDATKLQASSAVDAANIYKDVLDTLNQAKNFTQQAQISSALARKVGKGKKEKAKESRQKSEQIQQQASELEDSTANELKQRQAGLQQRVDALLPQLEKTVHEYNQLNLSKDDNLAELDKISEQSDTAHNSLLPLNDTFSQLKPAIVDADIRVKQLIDSNVDLSQSTESAKDQIKEVEKEIPESKKAWEEVKLRLDNTSSLVEECRSKLALLKEKIAVARDKANRIKLGAHFEKGSVLELPVAQHSDDFGAYTQIRLFFRTREDNGILLYFGNDNARIAGEFIAIELENGRPKLTLNFGRDAVSAVLEVPVNDFHWREVIVERVGKRATIRVTKPRSDEFADEQTIIAPGAKSVLNFFDDSRRLFVGGVPAGFKIPSSIHQHSFVGDLDKLRLNGELIGFWNSEKAVHISGAEMRTLLDEERNAESGVSFNGKGYMQLGVGSWNPRKKTAIMLSFFTYSPDGLLFFVGFERDQLVLELIDGRISLSFDLGSGLAKLLSNEGNYNDGKWHNVHINRVERQAKLEIDGKDVTEGESPGSLFEMSVSDSFYVVDCPEILRPGSHKAKATKGVQSSCLNKEVRVVSLISERSHAQFTGLNVDKQIELSLRFRTTQPSAHLATVMIADEEVVKIDIESAFLVVRSNGEDSELIKAELSTRMAGHWHYVSVVRNKNTLKMHLDDVFSEEVKAGDVSDVINSNDVVLIFGHSSSSETPGNFIGCIGDVIYNGKLLSFAESTFNEVKLTGCTIGGVPITSTTGEGKGHSPDDPESAFKAGNGASTAAGTGLLPSTSVSASSNVRPEGSCALPEVSHGEREDSHGIRFGLAAGSRLEFDRPPDSFDRNIVFSVQLRATAANGIIMFVTNEKHSDYMALYMQDGKIFFSFGSGTAQLTIQGKQSLLDDEWHSVRAEREGTVAALFIDGRPEAENQTEGTELIDAQPPLYIGGLPTDLVPFASRILPGVKSEFGGCLRDFKLNDKKFDDTGRELGTVSCAQYTENGIYFAKDGGYAIINPQFVVGQSFSFELEIKPRTKNAVLLSVGKLEFLTLQILNGTVKFSVDNGAGVESVIFEPTADNLICDGHWHQIKLYKKKNLITLNVDGKSNLKIMKKKSATDASTKDPLYLGGVPKDIKLKGLDTVEPYIGCVRILSIGKKTRKRSSPPTSTSVDLSEMTLFGSVERNSCPLN